MKENRIAKRAFSYRAQAVPYEGEIGAGRLLPFIPKGGTVEVAVPDYIPETEPLGTMTVRGRSLSRVGIDDGDIVLLRKIFTKSQIKPDTICSLYIPATGEVVAKKITFREERMVLRYCGYDDEGDIYVDPDDVDIRGIVISVSRHKTEWPFIDEHYSDVPL